MLSWVITSQSTVAWIGPCFCSWPWPEQSQSHSTGTFPGLQPQERNALVWFSRQVAQEVEQVRTGLGLHRSGTLLLSEQIRRAERGCVGDGNNSVGKCFHSIHKALSSDLSTTHTHIPTHTHIKEEGGLYFLHNYALRVQGMGRRLLAIRLQNQ